MLSQPTLQVFGHAIPSLSDNLHRLSGGRRSKAVRFGTNLLRHQPPPADLCDRVRDYDLVLVSVRQKGPSRDRVVRFWRTMLALEACLECFGLGIVIEVHRDDNKVGVSSARKSRWLVSV